MAPNSNNSQRFGNSLTLARLAEAIHDNHRTGLASPLAAGFDCQGKSLNFRDISLPPGEREKTRKFFCSGIKEILVTSSFCQGIISFRQHDLHLLGC